MYTGPTISTNGLVFYLDAGNSKSIYKDYNILDCSTWTLGSGSTTYFSMNGTSTENVRISATDPFGKTNVIWEAANNDLASDADGGWNGSQFAIDNTKTYRYSVWVNRVVQGNGHAYLGTNGDGTIYGLYQRNDGTLNTNAYFYISSSPPNSELPTNEWILVVGHVWPVGSGIGSNHVDTGKYTINGVKTTTNFKDYIWTSGTTSSNLRTYLYYSTDSSTVQRWCYPRVDLCDGNEPTIQELLNNVPNSVYDLSANKNDSVLTNNIDFNTAKNGNLVFDGVDDYVDFYAPNLTTTATVEMWCKIGAGYSNKMFFGWHFYDVYTRAGALGFNTANNDSYGISSSDVSNLGLVNNWAHYVFEMRSDVSYTNNKLYINGVLQSLSLTGTEVAGNRNFNSGNGRISVWRYGNGDFNMPMNLSSFKVYNRVLTQAEITQNFNATKSRFGL